VTVCHHEFARLPRVPDRPRTTEEERAWLVRPGRAIHPMTTIVPAEGVILDRILESTCSAWHDGLNRQAYRRFDAAQMKTAWASRHQTRYALVEGADVLASATQYNLAGVLDRQPVRVCGIGTVFSEPPYRGRGHARALVERTAVVRRRLLTIESPRLRADRPITGRRPTRSQVSDPKPPCEAGRECDSRS